MLDERGRQRSRLRNVALRRGSLGPGNRATQRYKVEGRRATNSKTIREQKNPECVHAAPNSSDEAHTCRVSDCGLRPAGSPTVGTCALIPDTKRGGWRSTRVITVTIVRRNSVGKVLSATPERPKCHKHVVTKTVVRGKKSGPDKKKSKTSQRELKKM